MLDSIPTQVIFERMDAQIARGRWFFIFNQVADLPEALIAGREEVWLRFIFQGRCCDAEALIPEEIGAYVSAYRKPGAVRGATSDYRAGREDAAQDKEDADKMIACPTLALCGQESELVGRMFGAEAIWREMATDLRTVSIPRCGHLPHEERPG